MTLWGWLVIALALALVALVAYTRQHRRPRPVDPALVVRDPAEQPIDRDAQRRAMEVKYDDPGW